MVPAPFRAKKYRKGFGFSHFLTFVFVRHDGGPASCELGISKLAKKELLPSSNERNSDPRAKDMNSIPTTHISSAQSGPASILDAEELELQHFTALQTLRSWQEIWELFYSSPWFRYKLRFSVRKTARDSGLGSDCQDDIMQEALIELRF